ALAAVPAGSEPDCATMQLTSATPAAPTAPMRHFPDAVNGFILVFSFAVSDRQAMRATCRRGRQQRPFPSWEWSLYRTRNGVRPASGVSTGRRWRDRRAAPAQMT